jgi:hypothetical protein
VQKWVHAFTATHDESPYSIAVLGQPYNSDTGEGTGEHTVYLTRLCNHPCAPKNTSSWFIARIRDWLRQNTNVEELIALAGIGGNEGTVYKAAGMTQTGVREVTHPRMGNWERRRYVEEL